MVVLPEPGLSQSEEKRAGSLPDLGTGTGGQGIKGK